VGTVAEDKNGWNAFFPLGAVSTQQLPNRNNPVTLACYSYAA
jgi:hypothetical protein